MNWEAIGALAEVFGALAVVASLVYLGRQLQMTRRVEQVSAFQGVFNGFTHHAGQFFSASDGLAFRGLSDRAGLNPRDRMLFDQLLANTMNQLEMTSWLIKADLMREQDMDTMDWWLEHKIFCHPGACEWLEEYAPTYPPEYVTRMRRAAENADRRPEDEEGVADGG